MQDPRIRRPHFFRFNKEIYFVARNEAFVRHFNRRFVSTRTVLWSNQAAISSTIVPPCYCLTVLPTEPSDFCLNSDKIRPRGRRTFVTTQRSRLTTCPSPTTWPMQRCLPSVGRPFRPYTRLQLQRLSPSAAPSTGCPHCPRRPSTARRPFADTRSLLRFPPRRSCDRLSVVPTVSRRCQRRPPKHVFAYENAGCQFTGLYSYEVCSLRPSTKCHGLN